MLVKNPTTELPNASSLHYYLSTGGRFVFQSLYAGVDYFSLSSNSVPLRYTCNTGWIWAAGTMTAATSTGSHFLYSFHMCKVNYSLAGTYTCTFAILNTLEHFQTCSGGRRKCLT